MIPLKLNAAIGGYFGPSSRIEWDGKNLFYLFNPSAHAGEPGTEKTLVKDIVFKKLYLEAILLKPWLVRFSGIRISI